jgi:hypothetical protein
MNGAAWTRKEIMMGSIHLIRIPDKASRIRAIAVFEKVPLARVRLPGDVMGVTDEHIAALKLADVPFEYVSKEPVHGKGSAAV